MEKHLQTCQVSTKQMPSSAPAPIQSESDTSAAPAPFLLPPSALPHVSPISESTVPPPKQDVPSAQPATSSSAQHTKRCHRKAKCPHCNLICLKKNLNKHIQRKHIKKSSDSVLKSVCVDATNGISAVQKTTRGFSVPIHVQKKTWGHLHKVQCELEDCRQYHQMALRSGLTFSQCEYIRSLEHCREIATEEWLKEETACTKRQKHAQKAHVPLCVEVAFQKNPTQFCFSIHEPALHHYSRLGRVMVTYNSTAHTWHCPCAKPRISCVHKNIGKWHLFQKNPDIFRTETAASTPLLQQHSVYPPSAEILELSTSTNINSFQPPYQMTLLNPNHLQVTSQSCIHQRLLGPSVQGQWILKNQL